MVAIPPESGEPGRPGGPNDETAVGPPEGNGLRGGMSARIDAMMASYEDEAADDADAAGDPGGAGDGDDADVVPQPIEDDAVSSVASAPVVTGLDGVAARPDADADAGVASVAPDRDHDAGVPEAIDPDDEPSGVEELSMDDVAIEAEAAPLSTAPPPRPPPRPGPVLPPLPPARPPLPPLARPPARIPAPPPRPPAAVIPPRLVSVPPVVPGGPSPAALADEAADREPGVGAVSDASIPIDLAEAEAEVDIDVAAEPSRGAPAGVAVSPPPELPLEHRLETPTAIERALGDLGEAAWEARAEELTRALEHVTDRERLAELAYELGELCERRLADEARAVKAFGKALATDPSLRANLWAIRRVFYRRGLWPNLVKLIDAEGRFARDDVERADLHAEKALVLAERMGQLDEARTALEEATHLDPTALSPLYALERMALADNDRTRLAELWAQLAEVSTRPERKLVYLIDQARFWADEGGDFDRARMLLAEAATLGVEPERVARERLRVAELAGDGDELLAALEQEAALILARSGPAGAPDPQLAPAAPGAPPSRGATLRLRVVALRRRQAQLARAAGDGDRAWNYLQAALALAPGEALLLADLADLAEELGRYDELADLVQSWQSVEGDPRRALTLSIRRADALLRGGQREPALALLASIDATAPGLASAAALRERDALTALDFVALAETWSRAGDALAAGTDLGTGRPTRDVAAAVDAYVAAATVWSHDVADARGDEAAQAALGRALALVPRHPVALEAVIDLHERAGRSDQAAALLEEAIARAAPAEAPELLARLGRLLRSLGRLEDALAVDQRRFAAEPADLVTGWRIDSTLDELGRDDERLANLRRLAAGEDDPGRKGLALVTAARLAEVLGQGDAAIELYRETLALWPDDGFARVALRAALRRAGRWEELAAARLAEAGALADGPEAVEALVEAAWVLEDLVGDVAAAHDAYGKLVDRAPAGDPALLHARAGLVRTAPTATIAARALEVVAEEAGGDLEAPAAIELARAQERAGETAAAVDSYRRALGVAGPGTVAAALSAIALGDLAQRTDDPPLRVEAARALADRAADAAVVAALQEDLGWLHALGLEDFDQAAQAFARASDADPGCPGALLGAALVAARRQDAAGLASAYERLAARLTVPEAAAALHLRAAALATAAGEHELAMTRVTAARAIAPDDVGALLVAAEHSAVATPPAPGEDPAAAVDRLLARADILAMRSSLADDPAARDGWELDRAEALEAAGRLKEAGAVVTGVLRANPADLRALRALHRLAARGQDRPTQARAAVALAQRTADVESRRALWADAAAILDPGGQGAPPNPAPGSDVAAAVAVYRQMLADEPGSPAFARLCQLLRGADDVRGLVRALAARLSWLDEVGDGEAAVPLLLERAQLRHGRGDRHGARADLQQLLARAPDHAPGLRLAAEIAVELGDAPGAVELWRGYLASEREPARRGEAEVILARILAEDMGDLGGAIQQLEHVIAQRPQDVALRDRLVGLATRAQDWGRAARELRELTRLRPSPGERARDELRLGQLLRDHLNERAEARAAFERGRQLDPLNLDLLRDLAELVGGARPAARAEVIGQGIDDLRAALATNPGAVAVYDRLATAFGWLGDRDGQWLALCAIEALGQPTAEQRQVLAAGRGRALPPPSRQAFDAAARAQVRAPGDGVLSDVWRHAAAAITAAVGVDPARLGFGKGDRVATKALGPRHEALAAGLASFGLDAELYVSEQRAGAAWVLSGDTPVLCVGADVAAGTTPLGRHLLGRALWMAADGTGALADLKEAEVIWYLIASLRAAEVMVPPALLELAAGEDAAVAERARLVAKHIARRDRKAITALGARLGQPGEPRAWRRAKLASARRSGLLFGGDLAVALGAMDVGKGGRNVSTDPVTLDLVAWSVSAAHLGLRRARQLALPVGGAW